MMKNIRRPFWLGVLAVALGLLALTPTRAQEAQRTFPETGYTVAGLFLSYWDAHGGLPQQGFPISAEFPEVSVLDGKTYTVQYFERAVFERHPENAGTPFAVLLAQLGTYELRSRYPAGPPPGTPNPTNPRLFPETGHSIGGAFRTYWESHGALAQQGYPLTDEFQEQSTLDGKTYTVQYFERAVFELHPENAGTPFEVLLTQLGTYQYDRRYKTPAPTAPAAPTQAAATATPVPPTPVPPTAAPPSPTPGADSCDGIPAGQGMELFPTTPCYPVGAEPRVQFIGNGFQAGEAVGVYVTAPDGAVLGTTQQLTAAADGRVTVVVQFRERNPWGLYAMTMEGVDSHQKAVGYLKFITPQAQVCPDVPVGQDTTVAPNCGPPGTTYYIEGHGFTPGEVVGVYVTYQDTGEVGDLANYQVLADARGYAQARITAGQRLARRAVTLEGITSHHTAIGFYDVRP